MSSTLKIICLTAVTAAVGIGGHMTYLSQAGLSLTSNKHAAAGMLTAFEPDPNLPPVVTQGSGTR